MHKIITYFEIIWPIILFRYQWTQGDPYWEAVNLGFTFTRGDWETEDRTKVSTLPLFGGLSINNDKLRDNSIKIKCMAMQTWLETTMINLRFEKYVWHEIIEKNFPPL